MGEGPMLLTENQLDEWVRGNARDAQGLIVELVWRLVAASSPKPKERRFPLTDSIGQHGPDGVLDTDIAFDPFVPEGRSFWEIGTNLRAGDKATSDYRELTAAVPEGIRQNSTFVFVTPLSGRRDWEHTWKEDAQGPWLQSRKQEGRWKDVRVIDGTKLVDWLHLFPAVEIWLAQRTLGLPANQIETLENHWTILRSVGEPPPLSWDVFLANREDARTKLSEVFADTTVQLKLNTRFPDQVVDFVSACAAALDSESRMDVNSRCLVLSGVEAWQAIANKREKHILVADPVLDLTGAAGTKLIQMARRNGHALVYGGPPGGVPDPSSVNLTIPRNHHLQEALVKSGYSEERARIFAQKSGGNLGSLLRCLQNMSVLPEWANSGEANELTIAAILGAWSEDSEADRAAVEYLSGKSYGEWIGTMREIAARPGTPLIQRDGKWKFIARYEGWYALGARIFKDHLERFSEVATSVFSEPDPQFDLSKDQRFAAKVHGKSLAHSELLRNGLAETLALLGSQPKALTSCSAGSGETTAIVVVRKLLSDQKWSNWAGLTYLLPLLAESAPSEFLDAVDAAIAAKPCPFDEMFQQEGGGITGRNYMTGLLWALETLAWEESYLTRAIMCLGELASRDPGGQWGDRPENSLTTILLPWLPQTVASIPQRVSAVKSLLSELPDVGWKLVLSLLPQSHSSSSGSHKPVWRQSIPDDWSSGVTVAAYWEQTEHYSKLAIATASESTDKLVELIDHMDNLSPGAFKQLLAHLQSQPVLQMAEVDRFRMWTELTDLTARHQKFSDTEWAMPPAQIAEIAAVSDLIEPKSPAIKHRRLFGERDFTLFGEKGDYDEQRKKLQDRRQEAIREIYSEGGISEVIEFARNTQSPWNVGLAFGSMSTPEVDNQLLPAFLSSDSAAPSQFVRGFVWGRYWTQRWQWVDSIDLSSWSKVESATFLSYLPFDANTWERVEHRFGTDQGEYWKMTYVNPYQASEKLEYAVDQLVSHGRPFAAINCLYKMVHNKERPSASLLAKALMSALSSSESQGSDGSHEIVDVVAALQNHPDADPTDLFHVEWSYLPILNEHHNASPKYLGQRLANDPSFFCEVIRLVFRSKNEDAAKDESTTQDQRIASNAYRLLREWQTPPGTIESGGLDGSALARWLEAVKRECAESGHLEVAMSMIGHVLAHAPKDPDGLWIHRVAATVLNSKDAGDMRDGFRIELFNQRGVHAFTAGREEIKLATKYRGLAADVELAGFHRLASILVELAESYERDASRAAARDPFDE
jgi:hypothetical protein